MEKERIKIICPHLKLESNTIFKKVFNKFLFHPIINSLRSQHKKTVSKTHDVAKKIIDNKTTHKALEVLYMKDGEYKFSKLHERFFYKLWLQTNNAKAVRNRLKITECLIEKHIRFLYDELGIRELNLLSIASGSARSFFSVFKNITDLSDLNINMTFLDKNEHALDYSKSIFMTEHFDKNSYNFNWVNGTANGYLNSLNGAGFHLVEMVGLMDYFDDEKVIQTFSSIYENLTDNGCLITANIIHNSEKKFATNVVGWRMIYRQPNEFVSLVKKSYFKETDDINHIVEPLKIHTIVSAVKK